MPKKRNKKWKYNPEINSIILIAFISFFGIEILYTTITDTSQILDSKNWVESKAYVISSRIKTYYGSRGSTTKTPEIAYKFTFEGREFFGNRLEFPPRFALSGKELNRLLEEFAPRKRIRIFMNPQNPNQSVIIRPVSVGWIFTFLRAGLSLALLWFAIWFGLSRLKANTYKKKKRI